MAKSPSRKTQHSIKRYMYCQANCC